MNVECSLLNVVKKSNQEVEYSQMDSYLSVWFVTNACHQTNQIKSFCYVVTVFDVFFFFF